jgi:hypothetical protein
MAQKDEIREGVPRTVAINRVVATWAIATQRADMRNLKIRSRLTINKPDHWDTAGRFRPVAGAPDEHGKGSTTPG